MTIEWIRFFITAALLLFGLFCCVAAVIGVYRFGFVMNRMHAAGIVDTLGLFSITLGLAVSSGLNMDTLKLMLLVFFMWFTSPVSTHFLGQVEYFTNQEKERYMTFRKGVKDES